VSKKLKLNDVVVVITGNDKGRTGKVLGFRKDRVLVQGVNVRKKHVKKSQDQKSGQIVEMEFPINRSNIAFSNENGKPLSLKVKFQEDGGKDLVYFDQGKEVVYRKIK